MRSLRQPVHATDPDIATSSVRTLGEVLERSLGGRRANVTLLERELAIRAACGAGDRDLIGLLLAAELQPVCLRILTGLVAARLVAGSLGAVVFAVGSSDVITYVSVAAVVAALAFAATLVPAWRAGQTNPAELLRS